MFVGFVGGVWVFVMGVWMVWAYGYVYSFGCVGGMSDWVYVCWWVGGMGVGVCVVWVMWMMWVYVCMDGVGLWVLWVGVLLVWFLWVYGVYGLCGCVSVVGEWVYEWCG